MPTVLITHPVCLLHDTGAFHPESRERLVAVLQALEGEEFCTLQRVEAPPASREQVLRAHTVGHIERLLAACPPVGRAIHLDPDTVMSGESWSAALHAAGAVVAAVDGVMQDSFRNAFCAVRPPGHHAEPDAAMGFCLLNNVAIGALHARAAYGVQRIAVIDVDVHHGNGTQEMFTCDAGLFYASTHERGAYPGTGFADETGSADNIVNVPMAPGAGSADWRAAIEAHILPRLRDFRPQLLMISMGFDAHALDPLGQMRLTSPDYHWVTEKLCDIASEHCENRLVSVLEGGYDLRALAHAGAAHVRALMGF